MCTDAVRRLTVYRGFNPMPLCSAWLARWQRCVSILRAKLSNTRMEQSKLELLVGIATVTAERVFSSTISKIVAHGFVGAILSMSSLRKRKTACHLGGPFFHHSGHASIVPGLGTANKSDARMQVVRG